MKRLAAGLGLLVISALPTGAASFDCAKAKTPVEKAICAQPTLSAADETIARLYNELIVVRGDNEDLAQEQRAWLAQRDMTAPGGLVLLHSERIASLKQQLDSATTPIALTSLGGSCVPMTGTASDAKCTVEGSGKVKGDDSLSWQTQSYALPDDLTNRASVVLAPVKGQAGMARIVAALYSEGGSVDEPSLVSNRFGRFLELPSEADGTGHFNQGMLLAEAPDGWRRVDTTSWEKAFAKRLTGGLYAAKGIYPDFAKMTAETPLWQESDANCCATGGYARIKLGYANLRITFEDVKVTLGEKAANGE